MPLWHDVCSYPWKSCQFWCEYRAPDPTHTHILDAHLQNHWTTLGVRCYTTQSPGWSLCINNIYIYVCMNIHINMIIQIYIYISYDHSIWYIHIYLQMHYTHAVEMGCPSHRRFAHLWQHGEEFQPRLSDDFGDQGPVLGATILA